MQIAKVKFKYASQICIPAYYVVTRTLKINLKLNNKFLDNNENLRKKKNFEEFIRKFFELKNKYKVLKIMNTDCKNEV